ncbi:MULTISPECIES: transketolase family protein [unclassified Rhodococcus (in: high G+C Gram-positive bacteria)]|uniref:transketolase family protein n=1 Tax=unclassified Rhodococcus (in: high G+C Gram-positive bacteria) TaxID=192944 RepID=UPI0007BB8C69|nr:MULTISPECIES: transketolase [unclassified Rhodococcus (in: high G+C Gram-positive bacteria)]KZF07188.1 transketolase [Rhodococcus sp. EPR-147]KZF08751.1 transketolase [Rhodococcus sp. EPR-279]
MSALLDQREHFYRLVPQLLAQDERTALVLAEIGVGYLEPHLTPGIRSRVINVGIREQAMIGVAGGLALAGMRPIVHTFPPFLIERPFEQVKLDLGHQGVGAILVSSGGSYGWPQGGETHFGQRDVALLDTLGEWTVHVPGHVDEVEWMLHSAAATDDRVYIRLDGVCNDRPYGRSDGMFTVLQQGNSGTVISVGPMTDRVQNAAEGRDLTVLHASTIRPFDSATLRERLTAPDIMIVEPYLAGTSVLQVDRALADVRHRVSGIGVEPGERRKYGTVAEHDRANGLDVEGLSRSMDDFFG